MHNCLLLGNGGREAIMAEEISKGCSLFSILPYKNETIIKAVEKSGGTYLIGSPFDKEKVKEFIKQQKINLCIISSDNLLEAGLIDVAKEAGVSTFGPTKKGAKIEWSKSYALDVVEKLAPEMIVKNYNITKTSEFAKIYEIYKDTEFVVKPDGLTAGKGVKVGGVHFKTKDEGFDYAKKCLSEGANVIIQDKVEGYEFTVMGLTDGKNIITAPITYDYPYRFDDDLGPGTGGMGCVSLDSRFTAIFNQRGFRKM